jgi:hypothetical protein
LFGFDCLLFHKLEQREDPLHLLGSHLIDGFFDHYGHSFPLKANQIHIMMDIDLYVDLVQNTVLKIICMHHGTILKKMLVCSCCLGGVGGTQQAHYVD